MYHGRKRSQRRELTPEELEKAKTKLEKVAKINDAFLKKRVAKEYSEKTLDMTKKLAVLSPDWDTVWNYRREIIESLHSKSAPQEKYKAYGGELMWLVKLMKENPKSYTLWGHRQWVILEGLKIEKYMSEEQLEKVGGGILNNEIRLCDKMLAADERNFHCWNYRSWVINSQLNQYDEIEKAQEILKAKKKKEEKETPQEAEGEKETQEGKAENTEQEEKKEEPKFIASEMKLKKLKEEFEMTSKMIEKNFSNFSAWHYRSKLMLKIHKKTSGQYKVPLTLIESELEKIKHAIFTEPNDQSPWNYHRWLVSLLIPTYITNLTLDGSVVNVDFSDIIFESSQIKCVVGGKEFELESRTKKPESKIFRVEVSDEVEAFTEADIKFVYKDKQDLISLENSDINCFDELLEEEEDCQLAIQYKKRHDKKISEFKESIEKYSFFAYL